MTENKAENMIFGRIKTAVIIAVLSAGVIFQGCTGNTVSRKNAASTAEEANTAETNTEENKQKSSAAPESSDDTEKQTASRKESQKAGRTESEDGEKETSSVSESEADSPADFDEDAETAVETAGPGQTTAATVQKTTTAQETKSAEETTAARESTAARETAAVEESSASEEATGTASEESQYVCTISITCDTILNNTDKVKDSYTVTLAGSGTILPKTAVSFKEGETVFDVLDRACRNAGIQLEYSYTPLYAGCYIEGISNIYEFDAGEQSGWIYKVNGWFPNYGCSSYELEDGDMIEWVYTCDLGNDVGGGYSAGK